MGQKFIIQSFNGKMEIALAEDGRLINYFVQRLNHSPAIGSIYRGRVESVVAGMQAAFVDIGWERTAFLSLEDVELPPKLYGCKPQIQDLLKPGQSIIVQVLREALDEKGPKVSTKLSLPGRKLILVSGTPYAAISKKIKDETERKRLGCVMERLLAEGRDCGVIVRTNGAGCPEPELEKEFHWLASRWDRLQHTIATNHNVGLLDMDQSMAENVVRDYVKPDRLEGIYVNSPDVYEMLNQRFPEKEIRFKIHLAEDEPGTIPALSCDFPGANFNGLMHRHGLVAEIGQINRRKVMLSNGGTLVFDRTEALQVVDVNTGKYVGKNNVQQTILQMNLEAAEEIARQIRLRNWSGIILIDFIDMKEEAHREQVQQHLTELLAKDPVKSNVLGFTRTGLMELTRKKTSAPLWELLQHPCPVCGGAGRVSGNMAGVGFYSNDGETQQTVQAISQLMEQAETQKWQAIQKQQDSQGEVQT